MHNSVLWPALLAFGSQLIRWRPTARFFEDPTEGVGLPTFLEWSVVGREVSEGGFRRGGFRGVLGP